MSIREAEIAADTVLHPGVVIEGRTRIGAACEIQAYVRISDSEIGDRVTINSFCLISGAQVATWSGARSVRAPASGHHGW